MPSFGYYRTLIKEMLLLLKKRILLNVETNLLSDLKERPTTYTR